MAERADDKNSASPPPPLDLNLDRATETEEQASLKDFQNVVYQELECPVCLEIAVPPVTLCKTGHFICGICRKKLDKCVICRNDYTDARNYAIEKIVSKIEVKCKNKSCERILSVDKFGEHLESCDCRPILCNLDNGTVCNDNLIDYAQYLEHLQQFHSAGTSASAIFEFGVSSSSRAAIDEGRNDLLVWPKILFERDGGTFILNMQLQESVAYFWVTAMLPRVKIKNMAADIQIGQSKHMDSQRRNINSTIGILPVQMILNEIKDSGNFVAFPAKNLISLSGTNRAEDGPFIFHVELKLRQGQTRVQAQARSAPFVAVLGTDTTLRNGVTSSINTRHQCITIMKEYEQKSLEELRLQDYQFGRTGKPHQQPTDVFGIEQKPMFSSFTFPPTVSPQPSTSGGASGSLSSQVSSRSQWACVHCTFINARSRLNCDICNLPRAS